MDEFNSLNGNNITLILKELMPGEYYILPMRKINTKYGDTAIVKLFVDYDEKQYYLPKKYGSLSYYAI